MKHQYLHEYYINTFSANFCVIQNKISSRRVFILSIWVFYKKRLSSLNIFHKISNVFMKVLLKIIEHCLHPMKTMFTNVVQCALQDIPKMF